MFFDNYADWEVSYACTELNAAGTGYTIKTIGVDKEPKISMGGFRVLPDYSIEEFPKEFSMLILAGGFSWLEQKNQEILLLLQASSESEIEQWYNKNKLGLFKVME